MQTQRYFLFGLTVSEIAFILFFLLVLVSQMEITELQDEKLILEEERDELVQIASNAESMVEMLREATSTTGEIDLDKIFTQLQKGIEAEKQLESVKEEKSALVEKLANAEERLETLQNVEDVIRDIVDPAGLSDEEELEKIAAEFAELLQSVENELESKDLPLSEQISKIRKERADLLGRIKNLIRQTRAKGLGLPPCWPNSRGKPEYIFDVLIHKDGSISLTRTAPAHRDDEYAKLPGVDVLTSGQIGLEAFKAAGKKILDISDQHQCRHYVTIAFDSVDACRYQLVVEEYFYKHVSSGRKRICTGKE